MGKELEFRTISGPEEIKAFLDYLEADARARADPETKYTFQVGLKDLDFEVDQEKAKVQGVALPFQSVDQAERALREGVIRPTTFLEDDGTEHAIAVFDPQPVGFSGFMDCVTHSLALTGQGLFEVGRYPAMNLASQNRYWQWFLHRRLATREQVAAWQEKNDLSAQQVVELFFEELTGKSPGV